MEYGKDGAAEEGHGCGRTVAGEMEAAEALAGMAAVRGGASGSVELHAVEDQSSAAQLLTSPEKVEKSGQHISTHLCSTSSQPNPVMKLSRKVVTEAEKEEKMLRRVMANRESARQTILRRQAMHLELSRKVDNALEENENLKKKKELMVKEYNSLESRNEFLTAQLAKVKRDAAGKRAAAGEREKEEEPNSCPPIILNNPPSLVPCFWPSIFPYTYNDPNIPCSSQLSRPGPPVFLLPIPWLLPPPTHTSSVGANTCLHEARPSEGNSNLMVVEACDKKQRVSAEADAVFAAGEARRRRNELMKLKNCKYHSS